MKYLLEEQALFYSRVENLQHDSSRESERDDDDMEIWRSIPIATQTERELDFRARKRRILFYLRTLSFVLDAILSVIIKQTAKSKQDDLVQVELKSAIADAQMSIQDHLSKVEGNHKSDDDTKSNGLAIYSSLANACKKVDDLRWKTNFDKELMRSYCTTEARACHALGLEVDFLHRCAFDQISKQWAQHLPIQEWICNFLNENYKAEMKSTEDAALSDKDLRRIGFRHDTAVSILERASAMKEHLRTIDWVELFVRDEFKYNPVLSGNRHKFPFRHDTHGQWLTLVNKLSQSYRKVNVINLERRPNSTPYPKQNGCRSFPQDLEDETHRVLFHGTDHDSARDIFTHGVRVTQGRKNRDFSSGCGFYLTDDFKHAVEWAICSTRKPAVLVYRVERSQLESFAGYSLVGEETRNKWVELVKQYRSGKPTKKLRKSLREYDFIEGPRFSSCHDEPEPTEAYQMCVISEELAAGLDGCLDSALFYCDEYRGTLA